MGKGVFGGRNSRCRGFDLGVSLSYLREGMVGEWRFEMR